MNPPRDDEYTGLDDLLGGEPESERADDTGDDTAQVENPRDDGADASAGADAGAHAWGGLPADLDGEYAEAYRRGYERARRGERRADESDPERHRSTPSPAEDPGATQAIDVGAERPAEVRHPSAAAGRSGEVRTSSAEAARSGDLRGPSAEAERSGDLRGPSAEAERPAGDAEPTRLIARPQQAEATQVTPTPWDPRPTRPVATPPRHQPNRPISRSHEAEPTQRIEPGALQKLRESALVASQAASSAVRDWTGRASGGSGGSGGLGDGPRDRRVIAVGLGVLALLVIAGAFGLGRMFADTTASGPDAQAHVSGGRAGQGAPVYQGALRSLPVRDASASCQKDNSYDAAGNVVTYQPANAYDANLTTAWRCDGSGRGQRFTVSLPEGTVVAQVGLVPGYAKTDPVSGADRYAENNRITKVRWRFDDGSSFVQRMSGNPTNRRMRTMRIPETTTRRVALEILASQPGPRDTIAISELRVAAPRG